MRGPLHPVIYDASQTVASWWEASAPAPPPRPPLGSGITADVAVIGAGYAGLAAARTLAGAGAEVAVLDAGAIGWGASGRNGGMCGLGGHKAAEATLIRRHGRTETARFHAEVVAGIEVMRGFCRGHGLGEHMQEGGELWLAHSPSAARAVAAGGWPEAVRTAPVAPSGQDDIARHGGALILNAFGIHPLRLVRAIADDAEAAGARICLRSEVLRWQRDGAAHRLVTAAGSVTAKKVLIAANGFAPEGLHDAATGRAVPVLSNVGVTRPLTEAERARHPWLGADMTAADTAHLLVYFRLLPEGRLLFGMRGDSFGTPAGAERMRARLVRRMVRALPGFAAAEFTHFWRGPVCFTRRLTPSVGLHPEDASVGFAFAWHGAGINIASLAGRMAGRVLAGEPEGIIPAPMRGLAPRIPLPALRPWYVGAMRQLYWLRDRLS